jgi:hypothetical protein
MPESGCRGATQAERHETNQDGMSISRYMIEKRLITRRGRYGKQNIGAAAHDLAPLAADCCTHQGSEARSAISKLKFLYSPNKISLGLQWPRDVLWAGFLSTQ